MNDGNQFHPEQKVNLKLGNYQVMDSPLLFADLSSTNDSSYTDTNFEVPRVEVIEKRKRGRPRKYPSLPNNGKTFNCVPTSKFLIYPKDSPLVKNHMLVVAKLLYHRSYSTETQ